MIGLITSPRHKTRLLSLTEILDDVLAKHYNKLVERTYVVINVNVLVVSRSASNMGSASTGFVQTEDPRVSVVSM